MFGGFSRHFFRHVSISRSAFYLNFHVLATQDEGAGFGLEDGEGDGGDGDRAVGGVGGGICGEGCVDGFAWIGGGVGEVVAMEADGVGGELNHCALPRDVGCDGGCADGNHGGEDMPVAEERVGSDHGLGYYSGREVSIGHRVLLFAACECKKC